MNKLNNIELAKREQVVDLIEFIYNRIIAEAKVDFEGICWESFRDDKTSINIYQGISHDISNGTSGVLVFLIEYYRRWPTPRLKNVIYKSIEKTFSYYIKKPEQIGFYCGSGGFIYVLTEASLILNDATLLSMAKVLIKNQTKSHEKLKFNVANGIAGQILGALRYLTSSNDETVIPEIEDLLKILLKGPIIKKNGIYWDEITFASKPSPSFLYGNSGIVFVLKVLSSIFENCLINKVIEEALYWEDSFYDDEEQAWFNFFKNKDDFDYKKFKKNEKYETKKALKYNIKFSWDMGYAGLLIARFDDPQLINNRINKLEQYCINNLRKVSSSNLTIANGLGGILLTLREFHSNIASEQYIRILTNQRKLYGCFQSGFDATDRIIPDISLLYGDAGIGLVLLNILDSRNCIISPILSEIDNYHKRKLSFSAGMNFEALPLNNYLSLKALGDFEKEVSYFDILSSVANSWPGDKNLSMVKMKLDIFQMDFNPYLYHILNNKKHRITFDYDRKIKLNYGVHQIKENDVFYIITRTIQNLTIDYLDFYEALVYKILATKKYFRVSHLFKTVQIECQKNAMSSLQATMFETIIKKGIKLNHINVL